MYRYREDRQKQAADVATQKLRTSLKAQGAAYQQLDSSHLVQPGIDLVVSLPDASPGPEGTYSHHLDQALLQAYIDFCQENGLILFLDLNFELAPVMNEVLALNPPPMVVTYGN